MGRRGVTSDSAKQLDDYYAALESTLLVRRNPDYERLVTPNGNADERVHRWFRFKEAYSRDLLARVLKDIGAGRTLRVLDPFSGCGTSAVSMSEAIRDGALARGSVFGYECNPFLQLVAQGKLRAMQSPSRSFLPLAKKVAAQVVRRKVDVPDRPTLSTLNDERFFDRRALARLLALRGAIQMAAGEGAEEDDVMLASLCLGTAIEPSSSLRRDGRALRYVPEKKPVDPIECFLRHAEVIDEDMAGRPVPIRGRILLGDGRRCRPAGPRRGTVDLAIFSPPYPNNIDYTEVYKLEAWILGLISNEREFAEQRLRTLHSHPSRKRPAPAPNGDSEWLASMLGPLLDAIPQDRYARARKEMVWGYTYDMLQTLRSVSSALRPAGHLVCVVGASLHGTGDKLLVVAPDLLISRLAQHVGLLVTSVEVARPLRRRGGTVSRYLRESVIFAQRAGEG